MLINNVVIDFKILIINPFECRMHARDECNEPCSMWCGIQEINASMILSFMWIQISHSTGFIYRPRVDESFWVWLRESHTSANHNKSVVITTQIQISMKLKNQWNLRSSCWIKILILFNHSFKYTDISSEQSRVHLGVSYCSGIHYDKHGLIMFCSFSSYYNWLAVIKTSAFMFTYWKIASYLILLYTV